MLPGALTARKRRRISPSTAIGRTQHGADDATSTQRAQLAFVPQASLGHEHDDPTAARTPAWTLDEDSRFVEEVLAHGPRFTFLSRLHLPPRSADSLRRRWSFLQAVIIGSAGTGTDPVSSSVDPLASTPAGGAEAIRRLLRHWYESGGRGDGVSSRSSAAITQQAVIARLSQLLPPKRAPLPGTSRPALPSSAARAFSPIPPTGGAVELSDSSSVGSGASAARPGVRPNTHPHCGHEAVAGASVPLTFEVCSSSSHDRSSSSVSGWGDSSRDHVAIRSTWGALSPEGDLSATDITGEAIQAFIAKLVEEQVTQQRCEPPPLRHAPLEPLLVAMEDAERSAFRTPELKPSQADLLPPALAPRPAAAWAKQERVAMAVTSSIHTQMYLEHASKNHQPVGVPSAGSGASSGDGSAFGRGNAATAVMAAWLGGVSAPLWTNIIEQPRCLWKATVVPRVLGALFPMPFLCSLRLDMLCPRQMFAATTGATALCSGTPSTPSTVPSVAAPCSASRVGDDVDWWQSRDLGRLVSCLG